MISSDSADELSPRMWRCSGPPEIEKALGRLMRISSSSDKFAFCLFIDGLDEHASHAYDNRLLAVEICEWKKSGNVKICAGSRPYVEFTDTFPSRSRVDLHELTAPDIFALDCEMFEGNENFDRVRQTYVTLVNNVVR